METPKGTTLFEERNAHQVRADQLDLRDLRDRFAAPFDRAADALTRSCYDADDGIIQRLLVFRVGDSDPIEIEAAWLADSTRMLDEIVKAATTCTGSEVDPEEIEITGIVVRTILDPQRPLPWARK